MSRVEFRPDRADDKALVNRIKELQAARVALERELIASIEEYGNRRVARVRKGEALFGEIIEPILSGADLARQGERERIAAQNFEADAAARRLRMLAPESEGV
jgi:hypothetical protein